MKAICLLLLSGFVLNLCAQNQNPNGAPTSPPSINSAAVEVAPFAVKQRGPHHRVWEKVLAYTNSQGETIYRTNSYVEMATGLNVWNGSQWVDASEQIQITPNGASATNTQHQVNFAANINTAGSIDLTLPDGRHLHSHIVGLAYYDEANSNSVMFAQTKDSIGQLLQSSNEVVYTNAFTDFQADVRYTHTKGKFEQDVILRSQPPAPAQYGLNPQTTLIEIWTEFLNPSEPIVTEKEIVVQGEDVRQTRPDQNLDFGTMQIGRGRAFAADSEIDQMGAVAVVKKWVHVDGRTFLVEQIPLAVVTQELLRLPPTPSSGGSGPAGTGSPGASLRIKLPAPKLQAKVKTPLHLAKEPDSKFRPGFVMDYQITGSTLTNFTFQSDTTYFISAPLDLYGTNTIEGGTVIKCTPTSGGNTFHDTLVSLTAPYRPAIFTAADDDTVGTALTNGTTTTNVIVTTYLSILNGGSVTNMRFCYAWNALGGWVGDVEVTDCQFIKCNHPITINSSTTKLGLHNVLITMTNNVNGLPNFCSCQAGALTSYSQAVNIYGENVTLDLDSQNIMTYFMTLSTSSNTTVNFTNSIIISPSLNAYYWSSLGSGNVGVIINTNTTFYATTMPAALFQTVGAASYYLADGSPYRDYGNTNVSVGLLADLKQKTTYPPVVFAQENYSYTSTFFPQAQRDMGVNPDLGYHYDPIDYAFGNVWVTNATLTVTTGTVIAGFNTNAVGTYAGLLIYDSAQLLCQGTPNQPCRIINYNTVQEQSTTNWGVPGQVIESYNTGASPASAVSCRFTDFSVMAQDSAHFINSSSGNFQTPSFQDCQFHGGLLESDKSMNLTNCLCERVNFTLYGSSSTLQNCLFWRGSFSLLGHGFGAVIQDNLFDQPQISDTEVYTAGYNGFYYTNASVNILFQTNSHDVFTTNNFSYQTIGLSRYYQTNTSPFINMGTNTTADLVGLFHYTTQTNQVKETNSWVDIGFHYGAVNGSGSPDDYDGDGIPDYLEDANGNGQVDSGETNWQDPNDLGLNVVIVRPANNSIIP